MSGKTTIIKTERSQESTDYMATYTFSNIPVGGFFHTGYEWEPEMSNRSKTYVKTGYATAFCFQDNAGKRFDINDMVERIESFELNRTYED